MLYLFLKFIHILSSTILFGTGIGTACVMLYAHWTKDIRVIAAITNYVVLADWVFTTTSGIIQPLTGFWMVYLVGYPLSSFWIVGSVIGYVIAMLCWFRVVYLQLKLRQLSVFADQRQMALPPEYYHYFKQWFYLGWPAFISLVIVFYLMTAKPAIILF